MVENPEFSKELLQQDEAKNPHALERIRLAKKRIQSILDRETVSHQRTLEQKISEQGPTPQRVDPHLIGLAIFDLLKTNRLTAYDHPPTNTKSWYSNPGTPSAAVEERLAVLAPLYADITRNGFGNLIGDALEIAVEKCLAEIAASKLRYSYLGHFHLDEPKGPSGRFRKTQPPRSIGQRTTSKEADFLQFGHDAGVLCIECKNYREWLYPHSPLIKELIFKSLALDAIPVLIARRLHYTTKTNLLEPAGIIAHETYYQYYPSDRSTLAELVKHKRSLGFTDVTATEEPHPRTKRFFNELLFPLVERMAPTWKENREALAEFCEDENLAKLYTAIGSPAGGKWENFDS